MPGSRTLPVDPLIDSHGFEEVPLIRRISSVLRTPHANRVQSFSDSIFSVVAGCIIIPLIREEFPQYQDLVKSIIDIVPSLLLYFTSFIVVVEMWATHVWLFEMVEKVDELLVLFNLGILTVVCFLPFTFTLLGQFLDEPLANLLYNFTVILVGVIQFLFIYRMFHQPELLKDSLVRAPDKDRKKYIMYGSALTPPVICLISSVVVPINVTAANVVLMLLLFGDDIRSVLYSIYWKCKGLSPDENPSFRQRLMSETVKKERIEGFSDGVFAVISVLIILDVCDVCIPSKAKVVAAGGLAQALALSGNTFLAFAGTFMTVSLLWFIHHSLFSYIIELNKLMMALNSLCLFCIGLMPLSYKISAGFNLHDLGNNEMTAIQFQCSTTLLAGLLQFAIWVTACHNQNTHLLKEGQFGGEDHAYMTAKLLLYPLLSLVIYFVSFAQGHLTVKVFHGIQIGTIGFFIIFKLFAAKLHIILCDTVGHRRATFEINPVHNGNSLYGEDEDSDLEQDTSENITIQADMIQQVNETEVQPTNNTSNKQVAFDQWPLDAETDAMLQLQHVQSDITTSNIHSSLRQQATITST